MSDIKDIFIALLSILLLLSNTILKYNNSPFWAVATVLLLLMLLLPNLVGIRHSKTAKVIVLQIIITLYFLAQKDELNLLNLLQAALKFADVIIFLIFMSIYAIIFKYCHLDAFFMSVLDNTKASLRKPLLLLTAIISSIGLSFATNLVYGAVMPRKNRTSASVLSRAIIISMMLLPTTGSTAAVMLIYADLSLPTIILSMLPIALMAFILAWVEGGTDLKILPIAQQNNADSIHCLPAIATIVILILLIILGLPLLLAMSWSAFLSFLFFIKTKDLMHNLGNNLQRTTQQLTPEILLFIITGVLIWSISSTVNFADYFAIAKPLQIFIIPLVILLLMSITSIVGLHPMAIFGLTYPSLNVLASSIPSHLMYLVWIVGFGCSLLLSPVSVLTATSAYGSGLAIENSCYTLHWKFVLMLIISTLLYIWTVGLLFY